MSPGHRALNRLCKWRSLFAGWQLGTRAKGDPECDAVRDQREVSLLLRAENNALVMLLVRKGVFTEAEWDAQLAIEADVLNAGLAERFPGFKATDVGLEIFDAHAAGETMKGWRP